MVSYPPQVLYIPWIDPSMAVGGLLHEHHRGHIVQVPRNISLFLIFEKGEYQVQILPVGRNLHQSRRSASDEWLHPLLCLLTVVDLGPRIADA